MKYLELIIKFRCLFKLYRLVNYIYKFLREEFDNSNLHEIVADIIDSAKSISPNYVYACELIQWVENNLEDWCKKRGIIYET